MPAPHSIVPFRSEFALAVPALIVGIQREEFGVPITVEEQPDLQQIPEFYQTGAGNFWVAVAAGRVVGTIALKDIGGSEGALRKMFVAPEARGKASGVAGDLLRTLLDWANEHGLKTIYLGTTDAFHAAHRFYEKNGFQQIMPSDLPPSFPRMSQDTRYYSLALGNIVSRPRRPGHRGAIA
jgi:N-acetylglutamate synthase-like GNAT family acetyltransferase